jgi:hypothetical protein
MPWNNAPSIELSHAPNTIATLSSTLNKCQVESNVKESLIADINDVASNWNSANEDVTKSSEQIAATVSVIKIAFLTLTLKYFLPILAAPKNSKISEVGLEPITFD